MIVREHVLLKNYTSFRIGGPARYFFDGTTLSELKEAILFAKEKSLSVFILGGGSNTLFVQPEFNGVVIHIGIQGVQYEERGAYVYADVGAGESWDGFVNDAVSRGLHGIENLSGIPGSVGAAPIQNIGAYGCEVKDSIEHVLVLDTETMESRVLSAHECAFGYRTSVFKTDIGKRLVVISVRFRFKKVGVLTVSYKDLAGYFALAKMEPTLSTIRQAVLEIRGRKLPSLSEVGTAGSFFKNPMMHLGYYQMLRQKFPDMPGIAISRDMVKVPAGWLLDHIGGFRGVRRGDAGVWPQQALVLVNFGTATGQEIAALAQSMQEKIKDETGIKLEMEVVVV